MLAVAEDGARHLALTGVVAEVARLDLAASRRLRRAAEASGTTVFVIGRSRGRDEPDMAGTVAATRWRVSALPAAPLPRGAPGFGDPRWRIELSRGRGAEPLAWTVEACEETARIRLASDLADRPARAEMMTWESASPATQAAGPHWDATW